MSARCDKLLFLLLIVLVTLLFFVQVPSGGFQAKNGPTTPVDNLRLALPGLLLSLAAGTGISICMALSPVAGYSLVFLHSPAASSNCISVYGR